MAIISSYRGVSPRIDKTAFIAENAVIIGDVEIGKDSNIWYNCVIRGDVAPIRIGDRTNIQDGAIIHVNRNDGPAIIGSGVTVGHMAMIHACKIEDDSLIGMQSCILDFSVVETGVYVAAGAIIPPRRRLPTNELWAGNPARFKRKVTPDEIDFIKKNSEHYVRLAREYKAKSEGKS